MAVPTTGIARRAYTEEQWNEIKPQFIKLYRDEKQTLRLTMDRLRELYGFKATEKMYKTHIKKWGLEKYNKDDELLHLIRLDREIEPTRVRSYTINGRPTTVEDAKKHFRRKKVKSLDDMIARLPSQIPESIEVIYEDEEDMDYADYEIPLQQHNVPLPHLNLDTVYQPHFDTDVIDINMDDKMTLSPDDMDMTYQFPVFQGMEVINNPVEDEDHNAYYNNGVVAVVRPRKPSLLRTPGLQFATESFLYNMGDFSNMIVDSILGQQVDFLGVRRFNKLWDLLCTTSTHERQNRMAQAAIEHEKARDEFHAMLAFNDPWLLLSLCLVLNDDLSRENRTNARRFLNDMSSWTNKLSADHPIIRLVRDLQNTPDRTSANASFLIEATVRMISEKLNETVGPTHDLSLELARLHARTLTTLGMHSSAETLLSQDLAVVKHRFGEYSLQNFLRLSALARARYVAEDYVSALRLYQELINMSKGWKDDSSLADIKYGAMFFIANSHAKLGDYDAATQAAQETLMFAMEKQGRDHYWTSNAQDLIRELSIGGDRLMEIV